MLFYDPIEERHIRRFVDEADERRRQSARADMEAEARRLAESRAAELEARLAERQRRDDDPA